MFWEGVTRPSLVLPTAALVAAVLVRLRSWLRRRGGSDRQRLRRGGGLCGAKARAGAGGRGGRLGPGPGRLRRAGRGRRQAGPGAPSAPTPAARSRTRPPSPTWKRRPRDRASPARSSTKPRIAQIVGALRRRRARWPTILDAIGAARGSAGELAAPKSVDGEPPPLEQVRQRLVDVGEAELVAQVQRPPRHDPLAAPQHLRRTLCRI